MRLLNKLERIFGRFAIPHLSMFLVIAQVVAYLGIQLGRINPLGMLYVPALVLHGEPWRAVTMLFVAPNAEWYFLAFVWYMYYMMGSSLEETWGDFRYNLFILIGWLLTIGLSFLNPLAVYNNDFIWGSVFLAFAFLNPNFEIVLFFILPVKVKWLALLTWFVYAYQCVTGGWSARIMVFAAVGNFLLFFAKDIVSNMKSNRRRMETGFNKLSESSREPEARHRCRICGKTNLTNPEMDFRYCSQCEGEDCYCPDHIRNHEHTKAPKAG